MAKKSTVKVYARLTRPNAQKELEESANVERHKRLNALPPQEEYRRDVEFMQHYLGFKRVTWNEFMNPSF